MGPLYHGITITNYGNTRIYHSIPNHYILAFDTAESRVQTGANTPFRTELIRTQITCTDSHTHKKRSDRNTCLQSIRVYGLAMQAYIDIDFPDQRIWMRRGCGLWLCSAACVRACIVCWKMIIIWSVAYRMQCVCVRARCVFEWCGFKRKSWRRIGIEYVSVRIHTSRLS